MKGPQRSGVRPAVGRKPIFRPGISGPRWWQWDGEPPRAPRKGEHYLSGAVVEVYRALNDLTGEHFIAVPCRRQDRCRSCGQVVEE